MKHNHKPGTWIRRTHEVPVTHRQRGVRYHYGKDAKISHVTTMSGKPGSSVEAEALRRAKGE